MKHLRGFTLIELMVAFALGLIVIGAVTTVFVNTSRSRNEMEKSNRQTESGRYASQLLTTNLRMAGYFAEFDPSVMISPVSVPDPCATSTSDLINTLPLHVQGIDDATSANTPSCISDVKAGTDILVIRRANSCATGSPGCGAFENGVPHLQASLCTPTTGGTELAFTTPTSNSDYATHYFKLSINSGDFTLHKGNCTTIADIYRFHVDIYFVANNNETGDGIPTLKRASLGASGFSTTPLVDGVENMQIEYGLDGNNDGIPESYSVAPATVADWRNVMAVRAHLLARNIESTVGYTDNRTYTLGMKADGTEKTVAPSDQYKRHVYATTTRLANPSWRRQ